jgi:hypothetical protein
VAVLTAQTVAKKLVYQHDAKSNLQEAPGAATVIPADGSTSVAASIGNSPNITRIPKPGEGFPTGKSITHSAGTYKSLVTNVTQQSNDSVAGQGTATPVGMHVSADSHVHAGVNDLQAVLLNDVSSMSLAAGSSQTSTPTIATGVGPSAGLSQSPELG